MNELALEYLKQYVAVEALKAKLLSEESELARRAQTLCEHSAAAAAGIPVLIQSPLGYAALTLNEDWHDSPLGYQKNHFLAYEAVKIQILQTPDEIA